MHFKKALLGVAAATVVMSVSFAAAAQDRVLRLSHQWSNADVRHQVAEIVANHVAEADVGLKIQIFGSKSLFKPREQWQPTSRGQLDMTVFPLAYAGGIHPEFNLTLMPGLVKNHAHAQRLNESDFMGEIERIAEEDGVKILVHGWLAGGFAGVDKCITSPEDVEGLQTRAAGKSFEQMLAAAGASIASMASSEIYNAMQTGVLDAANTSSSSFVSYRIYEQVSCYTPAADYALWFMYQPMMMSVRTWNSLTPEQQAAIEEGAAMAEAFYNEEAVKQDQNSIEVYEENGVEIAYMTEEEFKAWQEIAKQSSYKNFVDNVEGGQAILDMALAVE